MTCYGKTKHYTSRNRGLQARLCKDSISEATDWKAMSLDEFDAFQSQVEESNEKLFIS